MRKSSSICGGLLFFLLVFASSSMPLQEKGTVTVTGIVANPVTGEPISGAVVKFSEANNSPRRVIYTATTNDFGQFSVAKVVPGKYRVLVEKAGFVTPRGYAENDNINFGRHMTLGAVDVPANFIRIPLVQVCSVSGRVVDNQGPVASVSVTLWEKGFNSFGKAEPVLVGRATTDDKGQYQISNLQSGEYYLRVESVVKTGIGGIQIKGSAPIVPLTYYPGVNALDRAAPLLVTNGTELRGIEIQVTPSPVFSVRMKLQSAVELPPVNFQIKDFFDSLVVEQKNDPDGRAYVIRNLTPGEYDIILTFRPEKPKEPYNHRIHVVLLDRDVDLKNVNVDSQVIVAGRVLVPLGDMQPNAVMMQSTTDALLYTASVGEDGNFGFDKVSQGEYIVSVRSVGQQYVSSMSYDSREVLGLLRIENSGSLVINVGHSPAKVDGFVRNSKGDAVAFGRIVLIPEMSRRSNPTLFLTAITDENGRFVIEDAPPGQYFALAWPYTPANAFKNPVFLDPFMARAVKMEFRSGLNSNLNIVAIEGPIPK